VRPSSGSNVKPPANEGLYPSTTNPFSRLFAFGKRSLGMGRIRTLASVRDPALRDRFNVRPVRPPGLPWPLPDHEPP